MEVKVTEKIEKSQAELQISIPARDFKPFIEKAARTVSTDSPIKGFRPGKAPVEIVAKTHGQERLLKSAMDRALPHFFIEAIVQKHIEAINRPSITIDELGLAAPFRFTAIVDVMPRVTLGDPTSVIARKQEATVDEERVEKELRYLAMMRSTSIEVARPAQEGDIVVTDFRVTMNGSLIEGGESKQHPVVVGEGHFIPDFERNLKGIRAGEKREFTVIFPNDFPREEMRGKQADVGLVAHAVHQRMIPPLNDEFAKSLGSFRNLEHLKQELRSNLTQEMKQKEHERFLGEIADKFSQQTVFGHIPDILIEKEIDTRLQELSSMLQYQEKTIDDYLARQKKTIDQLRKDMRASAEKQVRIGLTLHTLARQHHVKVSKEEIEEEANKQLKQYKNVKEAEKNVDSQQLRDHIESILKNRKTLEKLAELVGEK